MAATGYIILTVQFRKEGRRWTARCLELGTATFGRSLEEAKSRMEEAILLHLNTLEDVGGRERFFAEHKIRVYSHRPRFQKTRVNVPLDEQTFVQTRIQPLPVVASA